MKQLTVLISIIVIAIAAAAQTNTVEQTANYEAASWKTFLLDNPQQIVTAAPPATTQSKSELQTVKQRMAGIDKNKMDQIRYWNAGAPAYRWNQVASRMIDQKPELMLRIPTAWVNLAIYNATVLAWKEKVKHKRKRTHVVDPGLKPLIDAPLTYSFPCEHSVTAAAAATMLVYFFPEKKDSILQLAHAASQSRIDAGVQFPSDVEAGWKLGEEVAKQIVEKAKNDGSAKVWNGTMNKDPKKWTGSYPMGIALATFTPLVIKSVDQFRPPPPPDFENEMKDLKAMKQSFRTASLAYYWANYGGFDYWSELAGQKMFEYRLHDDAPAVARIYTVLHTAYHDAAIAIFDAKYTYWGIRPVQYDSSFKPLITTPPFPGYPSGHATGAATTAAVMEYFFPADAKQFQKLAQDCADSRFYAGIHFRVDNETGLRMGKEIGKFIAETFVKASQY